MDWYRYYHDHTRHYIDNITRSQTDKKINYKTQTIKTLLFCSIFGNTRKFDRNVKCGHVDTF